MLSLGRGVLSKEISLIALKYPKGCHGEEETDLFKGGRVEVSGRSILVRYKNNCLTVIQQ